ncbi:flagellar M-ring protein FliF [Helicobacter sp. CLO-3]|uniref:flagellar basal-body MS-ring/collar protein FliF n=1 Tax=unclassified Helicobacter TaxID=2593540 RepID=UPI000805E213|nr:MULTISPECIES: flagellar basal-body MS-ring/collar protein FliF [unclassified Helicobacter]OBV29989.1 flagellar M-ring protein FliF [Helicobacter sp. CLO-3]OHU83190.1 flagellar M-ring protein FliF [Helicobacter sp. CLO-3]
MDTKTIFEHITKIYNKLTGKQKIVITATVVIIIAFFVFLLAFSNKQVQSSYGVLFDGMDSSDSALVVEYLKANQIPYRIQRDNVIEIPADRVPEERIALAAQGIPKTSKVGFELFDVNNIAETDFTQQVKFLRATEGELTRTIEALEPIYKANIQIANPKESLFVSTSVPPTAAVMVQLKPGSVLSSFQITGIKNLVSAAIPRLTPDNVKIVDGNGMPLGEENDLVGANEVLKQRQAFVHKEEQKKADAIVRLLTPRAGGSNKVVAIVNMQYDFSKKESVKQTFDPSQVLPRSQRDYEKEKNGPPDQRVGGIPGAISNVGPTQNLDSEGNMIHERETESVVNNEIGNETTKTIFDVGKPMRLTASVLVNGEHRVVTRDDGQEVLEYVPFTPEEITKLENLVKNAIGFDESRGDSVTVSDWDFSKSEQVKAPQTFVEKATHFMMQYVPLLKYVLIALVIFIFYKKIIAPFAERMLEVQDADEDKVESLFEIDDEDDGANSRFGELRKRVEEQLGISGGGFSEDEVKYEVLLEKIKAVMQEKPEEIASLFQKLIHDEIGIEKSS